MSYQVLARKYRPGSFDTLVGQEHVVRALRHALEQQRLHHAYLFTGTRGVGKTTLSRILAKALNCRGVDGHGDITATPCGVCEACVAIDAGRFVDYIEMDAASNRGVDEMAQLLEQAVYAPSNARFKVYMIDEVHMLTNHAFNSMLKTLEEPPAHVKFILATTDPQKIPVTVLSRCLQFNLKQMPPGHIVSHLEDILGQEDIAFETPALRLLAQGAQGSMRDALSLTDQAIAYAAGKVTLDAVQGMLGALDQSYLIRVLDALAAQDGVGLLAIADDMAARSLSYNSALQDLGTLLHQVALAQTVPAALADDLPHREDVLRLATAFTPEDVQLFYQIAVHGRNELGLAPDEYAGFSMTLLRMLAFRPVTGAEPAPSAPPGTARAAAVAAVRPAASAVPATSQSAPASIRPAAPLLATPAVAVASVAVTRESAPAALATVAPPAPPVVAIAPGMPMSAGRAAALEAARVRPNSTRTGRTPAPAVSAPVPVVAAAPVVAVEVAPRATASAAPVPEMQFSSEPPPWDEDPSMEARSPAQKKTESSAVTSAIAPVATPAAVVISAPVAAPAVPDPETLLRLQQVGASFGWDGDWPLLAAVLPVRGVAQQLAQNSELLRCEVTGDALDFYFRLPAAIVNLCPAGTIEKLAATLSEHFGKRVRIDTETGSVVHTAAVQATTLRQHRLQQAETSLLGNSFVQAMMRDFGASILPGTIRPL
ncbi:DNA polymerase III subunit gamma/tau [Herbaspirillum sp. RTI4]|uniref:DNA polymerase III subunit gamma/tau n=1 Tax=Herbaspirillum sp. RTI4 TaxID=3048640 RepID=UPI002AB4DC23|nr:DNA polymerase III subunit gamma/tau [Herbaspirillum sp. RTI4]MDY7579650.1 DNA polymerase III subunit gamma/tau [Herbaspirillum sp. RTI4]MEA9981865.1 DNA polymerase III subunit gamma/tau [Herbaspirillum sp. RTI4]